MFGVGPTRKENNMKSFVAPLLAACLVLTACGGSTATVESDAAEAAADADATETTVAETTTTVDTAEEKVAEADDASTSQMVDDEDDGDTIEVSSLDDIPEVCRELMADFLREIEPIVSQVDWDNATMADFEAISAEFEPLADEFDAQTEAEEDCDIELEDDENFDLLIDFAGEEAPGAVGFLGFLNNLMESFNAAMDDSTDSDGTAATCEDAMSFVQGLADEYDSIADVPIDQLTQLTELQRGMMSCSLEELEFFNQPEISAFLSDF
jgi:hypothetical protein